ncbi:N-formylglutamate amidohydrolase [Schlegelella sp. S2-27]|uniref:N-formylglutamate amidohydrolase n=1 Tax=Caldimonas mangrovi TaxID=2944811 RepID=A0ABT0YN90_9BURK|nr:N-formylglutamate amidohydrolase [Caldimonas mangrovi]MCM5680175.1 N-formylglutamate amidohydrolase [Caldimonas mangrovi]
MTPPLQTDSTVPYHWLPQAAEPRIPLVFDSPHSWPHWPADVETVARTEQLMTSCDAYVDELWRGVTAVGGALLAARFHRAYIDANRHERDIDPDLIDGVWPEPIERSEMSRRGMGLIRRYALPRVPMYGRRLSVGEVRDRIEGCYRPYRRTLGEAIGKAHARFGTVWHVNCHSMKSVGNAMNVDCGAPRPDIVVSNSPRGEPSASDEFTRWVADRLSRYGYKVAINTPYTGGDIVHAHGRPHEQRHSVQIEINRALYINEATVVKHAGFDRLQGHLDLFTRELADYVETSLAAGPRLAA